MLLNTVIELDVVSLIVNQIKQLHTFVEWYVSRRCGPVTTADPGTISRLLARPGLEVGYTSPELRAARGSLLSPMDLFKNVSNA